MTGTEGEFFMLGFIFGPGFLDRDPWTGNPIIRLP
jgi:hypothetical protein